MIKSALVLTVLWVWTCSANTALGAIAFFFALDADFDALKKNADSIGRTDIVGRTRITELKIGHHTVFATRMGAGCVETAANAQALLSTRRCDLVVSVGPVGSLASEIKTGTWGRIVEVTGYQRGSHTSEGYVLANGSTILLPQINDTFGKLHDVFPDTIDEFKVASGEIFCASDGFRSDLNSEFNANVIDMNLWGLITVCKHHELPSIAWRIVSDSAGNSATNEFSDFNQKYDGEGGRLIATGIRALPKNAADPEHYDAILDLLEK